MERPAFDLQRALQMVENDADLLVATAQRFLEQNPARLEEMHDALTRRDTAGLERLAHGLAGAALNFAADDTERAARALMERAAARDLPALRSLQERVEAALGDLAAELSAHCTRHELRNVLIADDDDVTRMRLEQLLKKWGHRVTSVSRGDVALEILGPSGPPHLAIVDWMMPGLDGIELCRALRARKSDTYTYVILITARDDPESKIVGLEAGADDFLAKPIAPDELRVRLRAGQRIVELQERLIGAREQQRRRADRDGLTGVLSRRRALDMLAAGLERCSATGLELCVVLFDVDGFRSVNQAHRNDVADRALRTLALRMRHQLRRTDCLGRFGGDEFLAVLPDTRRREGLEIAQRICDAVADGPIDCDGVSLRLTLSAGIASCHPQPGHPATDVERLVKAADAALSRARLSGGNRLVTADDVEDAAEES